MDDVTYYIDLSEVELAEGQKETWLHAMPIGNVQHPFYGEIDFSPEALKGYAASVTNRVMGNVDPVIDYDHMMFKGEAAGWVKDARVQLDTKAEKPGLQLFVEWTDDAAKAIKGKKFRYFSPTFAAEWEDQNGTKFSNVIRGGGITNRPFLKNLVPLNLSELDFTAPVKPQINPKEGEQEVDIKKLAKAMGLSEDAGEEAVYAKLAERLATPAPPPAPVADPIVPPVVPPTFQFTEDLKKLAEKNEGVKTLMSVVEGLVSTNKDQAKLLRETAVSQKLAEFDTSQLVLTTPARELANNIALKLDDEGQDALFELLEMMRDSNAVVVELGERGRSNAAHVRDTSAEATFNSKWDKLMKDNPKMNVADAMELAAQQDPGLYKAYRAEVAIVKSV